MLSRRGPIAADRGPPGALGGAGAQRAGEGADRTVILNFHGVGTPGRLLEPGEARWWIERGALCSILDAVVARRGPGAPAVQLTVDDGNASDLDIIAPELAARGLTATFFVLAGRLGRPGSLSTAGLQELRAQGHRIGLHGFDHKDWRRLDAVGASREFDRARALLEGVAAAAVDECSVPFGSYSGRVLRELASRGFAAVYTSDRGVVRGEPWLRPRNCVHRDMTSGDVDALLAGRVTALRRLRRLWGTTRKRYLS